MQRYFFKSGPVGLAEGTLLPGILDFFEAGAAAGTGVLELIGNDVAAFCDYLVKDSPTYADLYQASINKEPKFSAKVASTRYTILRRDFRAVADALREVAALAGE